jgi:hypothetical protein
MTGHRQAAVALHALADADRTLVLAELSAEDQRVLRGYLAELDELGFASGDSAGLVEPPRAPAPAPADSLSSASGATLHGLLLGEPAALVAQVLSIEPWPWRAAFLALQSGERRERLRAAAPDGPVAPARAAFLVDGLRARLAAGPSIGVASAAATQGVAPGRARKSGAWLRAVALPWTR